MMPCSKRGVTIGNSGERYTAEDSSLLQTRADEKASARLLQAGKGFALLRAFCHFPRNGAGTKRRRCAGAVGVGRGCCLDGGMDSTPGTHSLSGGGFRFGGKEPESACMACRTAVNIRQANLLKPWGFGSAGCGAPCSWESGGRGEELPSVRCPLIFLSGTARDGGRSADGRRSGERWMRRCRARLFP